MGIELLVFLALGCIIGVISGLLGVGGGTVVVPTVVFFLTLTGAESSIIMKVALGTSFAVVAITSLSSVIAHHRRGSVLWPIVGILGVGAMIGVSIGSLVVDRLSDSFLQLLFSLFLAYTIINMLRTASRVEAEEAHPIPKSAYVGIGSIIGFLASFVGIGGGVMIVPVLSKIGHKMKNAIATSSAVGVLLALAGALSSMVTGWGSGMTPDGSLGYIYLPAFIGLSLTSIFFAPLGAKLVYILPVKRIRQIFAGFLTIILIIFIYNNYLN